MKIVLPIKQIPAIDKVKMDPEKGTMIRDGVESMINPLDLHAIAGALNIKEKVGDSEVHVITMGPPKAEEALREALAIGCDKATLLTDRKFAAADTWATSRVLAEKIRKIGDVDLIICGEKAADGDTGQVGPGIASFLEWPVLTYVSDIEIDGDIAKVKRLTETGYEYYESPLPLVITVEKEFSETRYPSIKGRMKAKKAEIPTWSNEELGIDESELGKNGSPTRVVKIFTPKVSREGEHIVIEDDAQIDEAADKVVAYLEENHLL